MDQTQAKDISRQVALARRRRDLLQEELLLAEFEYQKLQASLEKLDGGWAYADLPSVRGLAGISTAPSLTEIILALFEASSAAGPIDSKSLLHRLELDGYDNQRSISSALSRLVTSGKLTKEARGRYLIAPTQPRHSESES